MQIFDPIACGEAADTVIGRQMMSYPYVENHLNRNQHLFRNELFFIAIHLEKQIMT